MTKKRRLTPAEIAANKERANRKRRMRRLWAGDLSMQEICEEMEMPMVDLVAYAATLGLHERVEPDVFVPTPEEIRIEAAKIRMRWTQAEREARLGGRQFGTLEDATRRDIHAGRGAPHRRGE